MTKSPLFCLTLLMFTALTGIQPGSAQEVESMEALSTEAFLSLMDGDQLLEAGNEDAALKKYQESRRKYLSVREQDETYKHRVVSYRLELLDEKISTLTPQEDAPSSSGEQEPAMELLAGEENFQELYLQAREQLAQETARVSILERRMIEATTAVEAARTQLQEQSAELREARKRLNVLEADSKDVIKFNELLKDRSEEIEQENAELVKERAALVVQVAAHNEKLESLMAEMEETTAELTEKKTNTTQTTQRLILERNQLRDDKEEAYRQLAETTKRMESMEERMEDVELLEESVIVLNNRNETQAEQLESLKAEVQRLRKENLIKNSEASKLQNRLDGERDQLGAANQNELKELQRERNDLLKRNTELQQRLGTISVTQKEQDDLIKALQDELAKQQTQ